MNHQEQIEAVQRMQDYIDAHLTEEITLHELAQCAGYSPWHCAKMFKEFTGRSPFEYIRAYRLSQAALKLRDDPQKVLDIAIDFLFDSHEGFTRAFHKQFGINPNEYKKSTPPIYLFQPWSIQNYYDYLERQKNHTSTPHSKNFFTHLRTFPKRKLILRRALHSDNYFDYTNEVGCEVWGLLCSIKEALYEPIGMWLPDSLLSNQTACYAQGVEVPADYNGTIPAGFDIIDLPPCQMMLFQGEPFEDNIQILYPYTSPHSPV